MEMVPLRNPPGGARLHRAHRRRAGDGGVRRRNQKSVPIGYNEATGDGDEGEPVLSRKRDVYPPPRERSRRVKIEDNEKEEISISSRGETSRASGAPFAFECQSKIADASIFLRSAAGLRD